jgi:isomerase DpgB
MVTKNQMTAPIDAGACAITLTIDGAQPLSPATVESVARACERVERSDGALLVLRVGGTPAPTWTDGVTVGLVSKWERILRRLERLPAVTLAVAEGDCGGAALDAFLSVDVRIATTTARLALPNCADGAGGVWPGMALYRLTALASNSPSVRRAVLFGEPLDAFQARSAQVVDEVTDDVDGVLEGYAERCGTRTGAEVAIRRQLMADARATSFEEALGVHLAACDRALRQASASAGAES